jgi:hypothetical protein
MVYDIVFMVQHYGLCQHTSDKIDLKEADGSLLFFRRRP